MSKENDALVETLVTDGRLETERIINAFRAVDRINFLPRDLKGSAYADAPQSIGHEQTISAPHMVAIMTEALQPSAEDKVLEIGAGSGYQAAILSKLCKEVYTIERVPELGEFAKKNLQAYANVHVVTADGTVGYKEAAPYDKIMVTAAAPNVPESLVKQLKDKGSMAIPVGDTWMQEFLLLKRRGNQVEKKHVCGCVFVPLIGKHGWTED